MSSVTNDLDVTVATYWRHDLSGVSGAQGDRQAKSHWRTRVSHYRATKEVLDDPTIPFARQEIVIRVRDQGGDPRRGSGDSTFYTVVGPKAYRSLLRAYQGGAPGPARNLAALYEQYSTPEQLVNEAKVWSYWEHRRGWLTQLQAVNDLTRQVAATCLVRVLADWAVSEPALARCLACAPPMAAVEDLLVIWAPDATACAAESLLREVIELALGPLGATTDGVLRAVLPRLRQYLPPGGPPARPDPVSVLSGAAFDAIQAIRALPPEARRQSMDEAVTVLADTIAELADKAVIHG